MKTIYSDDYISIISKLRAIRLKRDIKQKDVATALGVNQSFVSKVENRDRKLDVIEFLSWIDALNVGIDEVLPSKYIRKGNEE